MWRRNQRAAWRGAVVEDLRSQDSSWLDEVIRLAIETCDVVFVSGISDLKLRPDDTEAIEAIDQLHGWYPDRDQYLLPVDPKRDLDRDLLRRLIPYTMAAEGWTMSDGAIEENTMGAEDSGRILWWTISPTFDVSKLPDGVVVGSGDDERATFGYKWMRRQRRRRLRILGERDGLG